MFRLLIALAATFSLAACAPVTAQSGPPHAQSEAASQRILFIGNSFTMGANSAALRYRPDSVEDLNGEGVGGIPALFAKFAEQAGMEWSVSHETRGGTTLDFHLNERREMIDRAWDVVVMQQFSVLDPQKPGDPGGTVRDAPLLANLFTARNPDVRVYLMAT